MTKEQIHRLIKKIRTRRDYYQMQKSLQIVADVLEDITDKTENTTFEEKDTLQSVLERGSEFVKFEGGKEIGIVFNRLATRIYHFLNPNGTKRIVGTSINAGYSNISLLSYGQNGVLANGIEVGNGYINFNNSTGAVFSVRGYSPNPTFLMKFPDATGDDTFSKVVVSKPDGTMGVVDREKKVRTKVLQQDYTPTETLEFLDTFTATVEADKTYILTLGLLGDERILSRVIIHNDEANLSVASKYLISESGNWNFYLRKESEVDYNAFQFNTGLSYNNHSSIIQFVIRPRTNTSIKIPTKRFSSVPYESKLLAGSFMKLEEIG